MALTDRDLAVLDLERQWWQRPGSKAQVVADRFGVTETRYYQLLGQLLDRPEALVHDPLTVGRLRRLRDWRGARRSRLRAG